MAQRHCQELYLDPKDVGKQHLKIFPGAPSEILTPWTPGKSQGTKILGSKIFSSTSNELILRVLWITYAKNAKYKEKQKDFS